MICAGCGKANRTGARFCSGCGKPLVARCAACGNESSPDAQFCDSCGAKLERVRESGGHEVTGSGSGPLTPNPLSETRKVISIVFADLIGSTSLHERLDPESVSRVMDRYHRAVRAPIEANGGTVVQLLGDGVMCAFGVPRVAEDDGIRAVRAAVAVQRAFREFASQNAEVVGKVGLRVAVNTGEVVVSDDYTAGIGDPLNVAARLQQEASDGEVLIGESTERLVRDRVTLERVGTFSLKGRAETVTAYRVVSLDRPAGVPATPFVGREGELSRLLAVYEGAVATPGPRLAVVLGSPGLGKSRLLTELARRLGGRCTMLTAQCDAAGGATFAPLGKALRMHLGIDDATTGSELRAAIETALTGEADQARIVDGIQAFLAGTPASPEEIFFVIRRLLGGFASQRPVLLVIDDLQWAEPLLLDLVEHLVQWSTGVPLLVLVAARPELRDTRSSLVAPGGLVAEVVTLGGLDAGAATRLAESVIGADELPSALAGRVLATSEGNPLFVGELVRMLVLDGALRHEGGRWIAASDLAGLEMPPTIHALLAARIERLRPEDRLVLERASVVGRRFSRAAVAHLLPADNRAALDASLESLRRSELIEPDTGWILGEPSLRFHHVLIRDSAYGRLLRNTRAELHERFAEWLVERAGESVAHDETIGWHLEQAHQHLRKLGPLDEHARALGERAARYLAAAGRRALARDDLLPAASLLGRAYDRLEADDPAGADLALDWCEALLSAGDVAPAAKAIEELARFINLGPQSSALSPDEVGQSRLRAWHTCFTGQLAVLTDPTALHTSESAVAAAAETLTAAGDTAGEAKAHATHALVLAQLGKIGACEVALDRALAAARRANERRLANSVLAGAPVAALWGPSPVTRASGRCLDVVRVLRITQGAPAVEAVALRSQAVLETLRGRGEAARRMIAASRTLVEELGITQHVLEADRFAGLIELLEGDAAAAEGCLRRAWDGLRDQGLGIDAAQAGALLARALLMQGRIDEAEAVSRESESLSGDSFKAAIAWRGVRAEVLAARGDHAAAVELARAAVEIAAATDDLLDHAGARASLAVALRAAGQSADAEAEQRRAIELWAAKGATLLVERARIEKTDNTHPGSEPVERIVLPNPPHGPVQRNHAIHSMARLDEAIAARNLEAVSRVLGDAEVVDHPLGQSYAADSLLAIFGWMIERSATLSFGNEPIAALGPWLALARWRESGSGVAGDDLPIGPFELQGLVLVEADSEARSTRIEIFADDKLGDAVVRLYERYAELLPEGSERTRAAAVARSAALTFGPYEIDRFAAGLAPDVEYNDRRTLGFGAVFGAEAVLRILRTMLEVADSVATRIDDVVALRADGWLVLWTSFGTDQAGGAYERSFLVLDACGPDGRVNHVDVFDAGRAAEALARFDAVTTPCAAPVRRVSANAATAQLERVNAAYAARDVDAIRSLHSDHVRVVDHRMNAALDLQHGMDYWRATLADEDVAFQLEPLAALGDALVLIRLCWSASASRDPQFAIGPFEGGHLTVVEVDSQNQAAQIEVFADDRLHDAVARLYERHSELLPEGPESTRAAATARALAALLGPLDLERFAAALEPAVESIDNRRVAFEPGSGAEAVLRALGSVHDVAEDVAGRVDGVIAATPDALLVSWTTSGVDRVGGGRFEWRFLRLFLFGAHGLVARYEVFEPGREAEALARFDQLAPSRDAPVEHASVRVENAATRWADRFREAWHARDWNRVVAGFAPGFQMVDARKMVRLELDRGRHVQSLRLMFDMRSSRFSAQVVATRGERLAVHRWRFEGSGHRVGPMEVEYLQVCEVSESGDSVAMVMLDPGDLDTAYAELDARYGAGEAAPYSRIWETYLSTVRAIAARDWKQLAAGLAPRFVLRDHRPVGMLTSLSGHEYVASVQALLELRPDTVLRVPHVLALDDRRSLALSGWVGCDLEGMFEIPALVVTLYDLDGIREWHFYNLDQLDEAKARFDAISEDPAD